MALQITGNVKSICQIWKHSPKPNTSFLSKTSFYQIHQNPGFTTLVQTIDSLVNQTVVYPRIELYQKYHQRILNADFEMISQTNRNIQVWNQNILRILLSACQKIFPSLRLLIFSYYFQYHRWSISSKLCMERRMLFELWNAPWLNIHCSSPKTENQQLNISKRKWN